MRLPWKPRKITGLDVLDELNRLPTPPAGGQYPRRQSIRSEIEMDLRDLIDREDIRADLMDGLHRAVSDAISHLFAKDQLAEGCVATVAIIIRGETVNVSDVHPHS